MDQDLAIIEADEIFGPLEGAGMYSIVLRTFLQGDDYTSRVDCRDRRMRVYGLKGGEFFGGECRRCSRAENIVAQCTAPDLATPLLPEPNVEYM